MAAVLGGLAGRYARVAVLSGRPVSFLAENLVGAVTHGVQLVGLYGMEHGRALDDGTVSVEVPEKAAAWRDVLSDVADDAESSAPPGVSVERKGLAVTLHYRQVPQQATWADEFAAATANRTGLLAHGGKMSVELRPPVGTDKGTVVSELAEGLDTVFFAGDDVGDLPAFDALARLRALGVETLAVAVSGGETPAGVVAAADAVVPGPEGLLSLLRHLLPG